MGKNRKRNVIEEKDDEKLETNDVEMESDSIENMAVDSKSEKTCRSGRSISKSIKSLKKSIISSSGKSITKKDKRKLKHGLLIKQIKTSIPTIKGITITELDKNLPNVDLVQYKYIQPKENKTKLRGIKKAKDRQKEMECNMDALRKIIIDPCYKSNAMSIITDQVEEKVYNQAI